MSYLFRLFIATITCTLLFTSCEKVIDVDLNAASPKYVIEGVVTDGSGPHYVRITQTKNFDENNDFEGVSPAVVTLADDAGNTETLAYTGGGVYRTAALVGTPGSTYYLKIQVGGETFTAESAMPGLVSPDSIYLEEFTTFGDPIKIPYVVYQDPPGVRNFYRHLLYVNNVRAESLYISTDARNDGYQVERALPLFGGDDEDVEEIKKGDRIRVEMQSIGKEVYDYFFSLDQTISQSAATPANPVSNIRGGALGYFSAHSVKTITTVVE
jgi:hypothetical protein